MSEQTIVWDLALIQKYNYSGPRYTSYPTALEFNQRYDEAAFQPPLRATLSGRCRCTCISLSAISCATSAAATSW